MPDAEVGLTIDTVMFTLFYPTPSPDKTCQAVWFPRLVAVYRTRLYSLTREQIAPDNRWFP